MDALEEIRSYLLSKGFNCTGDVYTKNVPTNNIMVINGQEVIQHVTFSIKYFYKGWIEDVKTGKRDDLYCFIINNGTHILVRDLEDFKSFIKI